MGVHHALSVWPCRGGRSPLTKPVCPHGAATSLGAMLAFRSDEYLWWQVAELTYDTYLVHNRTRT